MQAAATAPRAGALCVTRMTEAREPARTKRNAAAPAGHISCLAGCRSLAAVRKPGQQHITRP